MWKEGWLQHTRKQKIRGVFIQRSMFLCKLRCAIKRRYGVMRAIARFVCQSLTLKCSLNKKSNNFNVSNAEKKVSANRAPQHKRGAWFIALVLFYRMRRLSSRGGFRKSEISRFFPILKNIPRFSKIFETFTLRIHNFHLV